MGYTGRALQGTGWNGLLKVLTAGLTVAKIYVLARLLSPNDFGLFSLTAIALGITEAFTETGINTIIVQSKKPVSYFLDTAWIIAIIRGLIISIIMVALSVVLKNFFHEEKLLLLISLASFVPLIKGFINPAIVSFHKDLRFFEDTLYRFSLELANVIATLGLAFFFPTVYVFILGMIFAAIWEVIISFIFLDEVPRFNYLPSRAQEIFSHSKGLNLSAVLGYSVQNIDNFMIGKVLGTSNLGLYANGYSLSHRLTLELAKSVQHGTFPVYVKISHDLLRLRRAFWKAMISSLVVLVGLSLPIMVFPFQVVNLILSEKWIAVAPILPWLIVAGILYSVVGLSSSLLVTQKNYYWLNANLFMNCGLLLFLIPYLGGSYGLVGAVMAVVIARALSLPLIFVGIKKVLYE